MRDFITSLLFSKKQQEENRAQENLNTTDVVIFPSNRNLFASIDSLMWMAIVSTLSEKAKSHAFKIYDIGLIILSFLPRNELRKATQLVSRQLLTFREDYHGVIKHNALFRFKFCEIAPPVPCSGNRRKKLFNCNIGETEITAIAISPDGKKMVVGLECEKQLPSENYYRTNATLAIVDNRTGSCLYKLDSGLREIGCISISRDSKRAMYSKNGLQFGSTEFCMVDIENGKRIPGIYLHECYLFTATTINIDLNKIIVAHRNFAGDQSIIRVWDTTGENYHEYFSTSQYVEKLHLSPNGNYIVSIHHGKTVHIHDILKNRECYIFTLEEYYSTICISHDSKKIAIRSSQSKIVILELSTGNAIHALDDHSNSSLLAFAADDKQLVSVSECTLKIWDIESNKCLHTRVWENHFRSAPTALATHYEQIIIGFSNGIIQKFAYSDFIKLHQYDDIERKEKLGIAQ